MKILITGGAGFIGSHLSEELVKNNHEVTILDDLSTGRLENIDHLKNDSNFEMVVDSVLNQKIVENLVSDADQIYHLAAAVGVKNIIDNTLNSIEVNIEGTQNILQAANRDKTPTYIASTSEIYGKSDDIPFSETDDRVTGSTTISRWSYSCAKALDEFLALAYWREKQLPVVIGRFFNTVGPRQTGRYGMVIPRFVKQALLERPLTVHGDGEQSRVFLDVNDAVSAITDLMNRDDGYGEPYNIGGSESITIKKLAEKIIEMVDSESEIQIVPYEEAYEEGFEDMRRREPDINKLRDAIGFEQKYTLEDTLERVVKYFRSDKTLL